jgi:uncharacterized SAM-binding protein YcdF (DUF218 family)
LAGTGTRSRKPSARNQHYRPESRKAGSVRPRSSGRRRRGMGWKLKLALGSCLAVASLMVWATIARHYAPTSNTSLTRFDAIIVLGSPADADGNPTPTQLARVTEAVREYERGVAPRLILTGGSTRFGFVEAKVMARTAEAQGIPASALLLEDQAKDTIQNACYSTRIMEDHGWHSAEVVSSGFHLPRAGMIFSRLPLEWHVHAAPPLEPTSAFRMVVTPLKETLSTVRYLVWAHATERCELPGN